MDWSEFFEVVLRGFKRIGIFIAFLALCASVVCGVFSVIPIASGIIPFSWWYTPCWAILLVIIAAIVGDYD